MSKPAVQNLTKDLYLEVKYALRMGSLGPRILKAGKGVLPLPAFIPCDVESFAKKIVEIDGDVRGAAYLRRYHLES